MAFGRKKKTAAEMEATLVDLEKGVVPVTAPVAPPAASPPVPPVLAPAPPPAPTAPKSAVKTTSWTVKARVVLSDEGGGWKEVRPFVLEGIKTETEAREVGRAVVGALLRYKDEIHLDVEAKG